MSFSKTISVFAALASIFAAGAAGWKLAHNNDNQDSKQQEEYQQKITDLEKQVTALQQKPIITPAPVAPVVLPSQPPTPPPVTTEPQQ